MSLAVAFNNQLNKFIDELCKTYPEDKDFPYYGRLVNQLMKLNVRKPAELFSYYVREHVNEIYSRNSDFFLNNSDNIVKNNATDAESQMEAFRLIGNLSKYWSEMTDDNRKVIWDYLIVLTKLSIQLVPS
jgi:hypothetical protein